jgi:hypothetical protein
MRRHELTKLAFLRGVYSWNVFKRFVVIRRTHDYVRGGCARAIFVLKQLNFVPGLRMYVCMYVCMYVLCDWYVCMYVCMHVCSL